MSDIQKVQVSVGIYWVAIPKADLYILCGCPADSVKHLIKTGLIKNIEVDGIPCESGPNAILLSDVLMQNGQFANLAEFPVLQMLYRQGLLVPGHPNNDGSRPILMGVKEQVESQMDYIFRGNYGLCSKKEMVEAGVASRDADALMSMKLRFAFGNIAKSEELLDFRLLQEQPVEIKNGVYIQRQDFNQYSIRYRSSEVSINLSLSPHEVYLPPYQLGSRQISREYFSVVHSGDGDGWDTHRPCMGSILMYQGKVFLIDVGPNIGESLNALGLSIGEVEGVFHTHIHDDHFAGLPDLLHSDKKIKYYASRLVIESASKKMDALMPGASGALFRYFNVQELELDNWNNLGGLEVMPALSPHPVETNIYFFRTLWEGGYKSYAHFADITSFRVLKSMIRQSPVEHGVTEEFYEKIRKLYTTPVNLKKIDIGGGMIHGNAIDFENDQSDKIVLSHTSKRLTSSEKEIGSDSSFGMVDVLIPANRDYLRLNAASYLKSYFPHIKDDDLNIFLNCPIVTFNAGSILLKRKDENKKIYLVLSGSVELIHSKSNQQYCTATGALIGWRSALVKKKSSETYRALSSVHVLEIPLEIYYRFAEENKLIDTIDHLHYISKTLQKSWLFGDKISHLRQNQIAQRMQKHTVKRGEVITKGGGRKGLFLVESGCLRIYQGKQVYIDVGPYDFCGEDSLFLGKFFFEKLVAMEQTTYYFIENLGFDEIPVIHVKLIETLSKRMRFFMKKSM